MAAGYAGTRSLPRLDAALRSSACCWSSPGCIGATVLRGADGAARLHPDARPGLCHRRDPAAGRRVAGPHRRGGAAGLRDHRRRRPASTTRSPSPASPAPPSPTPRNAGVVFAALRAVRGPAARRASRADQIIGQLYRHACSSIQEAFIIAIPPPPIRGIGNAGGFKMQIAGARQRRHAPRSSASPISMMGRGQPDAGAHRRVHHLLGLEPAISSSTIDRDKARMLNVPIPNIFETLSINLGTSYVNDFNAFGRVYQVRAQADQQLPPRARGHRSAQGPLGHRRAGAARHAGRRSAT